MKRDKIIYWTATGLVSAGMAFSAWLYLSKSDDLVKAFKDLGYPMYFMTILGVAKLLGAIVLVIPVADRIKEWAYAGFLFTFIGAGWTHLATSTPATGAFVFLVLLLISYIFRERILSNARAANAVSVK